METFLTTVCTPDWNREQDAGRSWAAVVAELAGRHPEQRAMIAR
jgi:2-haloacid dehalogenase